ncbi:hypothetical protein [Collimonas sp. PA-H2]|uniref:hypothetical protein n=1 Tax=Collimonas sp. PA-H2 TaxID=1881062 RepID=UPI0011809B0B|nr:hypothetical protein [Collimonas sp. PA-H2]
MSAELRRTARRVAGWWQGRLVPARPLPRHLSTARDLSDHVLRDIGYIDALPPREAAHRDNFY